MCPATGCLAGGHHSPQAATPTGATLTVGRRYARRCHLYWHPVCMAMPTCDRPCRWLPLASRPSLPIAIINA
ncbi:hypothetical protein BHM03_00010314 [Ensete ventricosum]|nr:hypothetical protein BHM03_00010314 [Ensete ventricosum]